MPRGRGEAQRGTCSNYSDAHDTLDHNTLIQTEAAREPRPRRQASAAVRWIPGLPTVNQNFDVRLKARVLANATMNRTPSSRSGTTGPVSATGIRPFTYMTMSVPT